MIKICLCTAYRLSGKVAKVLAFPSGACPPLADTGEDAKPVKPWFEDGADNDARRGQIVGFFTMLEKAWFSACRKNSALDNFSAVDLLEAANTGLEFDEEAYLASLPDDE